MMTAGDAIPKSTPLSDDDMVVLVYASTATREISREAPRIQR